ncbi:hypothetical protein VP01_4847g1 [Puccinia sorghi]|uniref:Uncharacterized protein n=1 Tax=Puccinia sorghi TaxID=27349 RepID=A0A0L6UMD6_9BASI|nr:hypothetical protein VP01_4847g1 [Puccinia sorghi]
MPENLFMEKFQMSFTDLKIFAGKVATQTTARVSSGHKRRFQVDTLQKNLFFCCIFILPPMDFEKEIVPMKQTKVFYYLILEHSTVFEGHRVTQSLQVNFAHNDIVMRYHSSVAYVSSSYSQFILTSMNGIIVFFCDIICVYISSIDTCCDPVNPSGTFQGCPNWGIIFSLHTFVRNKSLNPQLEPHHSSDKFSRFSLILIPQVKLSQLSCQLKTASPQVLFRPHQLANFQTPPLPQLKSSLPASQLKIPLLCFNLQRVFLINLVRKQHNLLSDISLRVVINLFILVQCPISSFLSSALSQLFFLHLSCLLVVCLYLLSHLSSLFLFSCLTPFL